MFPNEFGDYFSGKTIRKNMSDVKCRHSARSKVENASEKSLSCKGC